MSLGSSLEPVESDAVVTDMQERVSREIRKAWHTELSEDALDALINFLCNKTVSTDRI